MKALDVSIPDIPAYDHKAWREHLARRLMGAEQYAAELGGIIDSWDDLLAAACINAGVPDSQYEAICLALTEILKDKGIEL